MSDFGGRRADAAGATDSSGEVTPRGTCSTIVDMTPDWQEPVLCGRLWPCAEHPWPEVLVEYRERQAALQVCPF